MAKGIVPVMMLLVVAFALPLRAERPNFVLMVSTIGPIDSGIVDALESAFKAETKITVRHVGKDKYGDPSFSPSLKTGEIAGARRTNLGLMEGFL
jgi:hypothetical protein